MSETKETKKQLKSEEKIAKKKENPEQKKKVEQQLEEDSSEEEEEVKVSRVGYLTMRQNKKDWKAVYGLLIGGSFYIYKNSSDKEYKICIDLQGHKIVSPVELKGKKKNTFAIAKDDQQVFLASCANEGELKAWVPILQESLNKEKSEPPITRVTKKKEGVIGRAKKRAVRTTATSTLGKKVMKTIVNEETTSLLNALKTIVKAHSGNSKAGEDLEKNIIRIAVKSFILIEDKKLTADDFLVADKPLRESFELMVKIFNGRGRVQDEKITTALLKVEELLKKSEEIITNLLAPYLSSKNMLKISETFSVLSNEKFLNSVFRNQTLEPELDKLIDAMEYYTQFHYH